ncbi:MAG: protein tyrosine phosphatase family protein [Woeseiaceae bacterium]
MRVLMTILVLLMPFSVQADEIVNYREYSPLFASAGQPTKDQFAGLKERGFDRVVYVAYSDHDNFIPNADRLAKQLGLQYIHIPVEWDAPTRADYDLIAAALQQGDSNKTLLHCQLNYRASAFAMLYRVLVLEVPLSEAKADMNAVWQPNRTWTNFLRETLGEYGIDPDCEGCDWTIPDRD